MEERSLMEQMCMADALKNAERSKWRIAQPFAFVERQRPLGPDHAGVSSIVDDERKKKAIAKDAGEQKKAHMSSNGIDKYAAKAKEKGG